MIIKNIHILLIIISVFILHYFIKHCGCKEGLSEVPKCDDGLKQKCLTTKNCASFNLSGCDLQNVNLSNSNLNKAVFFYSDLSMANLSNSNLQGSDIYMSNLNKADLTNSNLEKSYIRESTLNHANLTNTNLQDTDLINTTFEGSNLTGSNINNTACFVNEKIKGINSAKIDPFPDGTSASYQCSERIDDQGVWNKCALRNNDLDYTLCSEL